jgi:acyl carrier protein
MSKSIVDIICVCAAEVANVPINAVTAETLLLDELGLDSLACVELLMRVQVVAGMEFDQERALTTKVLHSSKSLAEYIHQS